MLNNTPIAFFPKVFVQLHCDCYTSVLAARTTYADNKLVARCTGGRHNLIEILKILQENQVGFGSVYSEQPTLNDVFLEITGKALRDKE